MNINTIQKHYDKLTAGERFALLTAAIHREDEADRLALIQSSPRKTWSIPTTQGLGQAFNFASMFHVLMQLGFAATFNYLIAYDDEGHLKIKGYSFNDAIELTMRRILEGREAWRIVCKDYGVDPDKMLEGMPFLEVIEITELTVRAATADNPLELTDLQSAIDGYREAIETKRKDWE